MTSIGDYAFAAALRDFIRREATKIVDQMRPKPRYAYVVSMDRADFSAFVQYEDELHDDEAGPVPVSMTGVQPDAVGQRVQLSGPSNDRYISAVFGPVHIVT